MTLRVALKYRDFHRVLSHFLSLQLTVLFPPNSFTTTEEKFSLRKNSLKCCYLETHLVPFDSRDEGKSFLSSKFATVGLQSL